MKINIKTNNKKFAKKMTNLQKKQLPFATAQAINNTLFGLKKEMSKQTIKKLDRPTKATQNGFEIKKANKKNVTGIFSIKNFVAKYLHYQIVGGVRSSSNGIPVPITKNMKLNKFGNIAGKRGKVQSGLEGLATGNQFVATIEGATGVWKKNKKGQAPTLLIKFHDSVQYRKKPFDFYKIGRNFINNTYDRNFLKAFSKAMKTAK
jgi:hypothetical protein